MTATSAAAAIGVAVMPAPTEWLRPSQTNHRGRVRPHVAMFTASADDPLPCSQGRVGEGWNHREEIKFRIVAVANLASEKQVVPRKVLPHPSPPL